jgi:predicted GNAT family acetyltransferase
MGAAMTVTVLRHESAEAFSEFDSAEPCTIDELSQEHEGEVLEFLAANPIHTVLMASLVRDNGLVSPHNRGSFYACRSPHRDLEGVALIGHVTVLEARTEAALSAFARLTRHCLNTHLIRGEREMMNRFWNYYANPGQEPRRIASELLFEQREILPESEPVDDLRPATLSDLDQVLKINATMAFQEGGTSPLNRDPSGFRQRTARRIECNRVFVWARDKKLIFKADVMAETPEVVYLEGVHVDAEERLKGYGRRCLTQLARLLMTRSKSICLTINQQNKNALAFYAKAGYQFHSNHETIYLQ